MIKFNDNSIISGFIKQLLSSFNLPNISVAKPGMRVIKDNYYLHNNYIVKALNSKTIYAESDLTPDLFKNVAPYSWNDPIVIKASVKYNIKLRNFTRTLETNKLYYDSHTHEYLGEYLRFLRDFKGLDLMSLYNCFSDTLCKNLKQKLTIATGIETEFNADSSLYKIYKIPVKLWKKYTIAIESDKPVELFCGLYGENGLLNSGNLKTNTYQKYNSMTFAKPQVYTRLFNYFSDTTAADAYSMYFDNLYMFLKLPVNNKSSIVILEGDYSGLNDFSLQEDEMMKFNHSVINYEYADADFNDIKLISRMQLLVLNTQTQHPFSSKLLGYLLNNTITFDDNISDNIKRVQKRLQNNYEEAKKEIKAAQQSSSCVKNTLPGISRIVNYGIWEDNYRSVLYDLALSKGVNKDTFDLLGYVDKDIELALGPDVDIYNNILK